MKIYHLFLLLIVFFEISCSSKVDNHLNKVDAEKDTFAPVQVTVISNLPDSLQPQKTYLDNKPAPKVVAVPKSGGKTINLPVLQNSDGETIWNEEGKPFLLGDGGIPNFTYLNTDNGLALDVVTCSLLDQFGNLWFGTQGGGVSRYDGQSLYTFTTAQGLAYNSVWSILEDKSGNLWFGTNGGGISRYNGHSFTTFTTRQGLAGNDVRCIFEDKSGNLWFGTNEGGVSRYDGQFFNTFTTAHGLADNDIRSISEDKTGNLWFGTKSKGVCQYDGRSFKTFTTSHGLADNKIRCIIKDHAGNIWFGTNGGGVGRFDGKSFTTFTNNQGLGSNSILCITEDKKGNLWFGTNGGGVSRYDGHRFITFTTSLGLSNNTVTTITKDKTGNLFFGTDGGGVSCYDGQSFSTFSTVQGLAHNNIRSITEDKSGNHWFCSFGGGVSRYDGGTFTTLNVGHGLQDDEVRCVIEDKTGSLWFGTQSGGISSFDGQLFKTLSIDQGLADKNIRCIAEDNQGNLWIGTNGEGVSLFDGKSFTTFNTRQGLAGNDVRSIIEDKMGKIWFGTNGGGVSCYDGQTINTFNVSHGLANNNVRCITEDKEGNLWVGTMEGLSVIPIEKVNLLCENPVLSGVDSAVIGKRIINISSSLFKSFKVADGLPDNVVTQIVQMPDGKIAVGTNQGIAVFSPSIDFTKLTNIKIFNSGTGYPIKNVNVGQNAMFLDSKRILWVGTGSEKTALVRFDYEALSENKNLPTLVIQSIKVKDETICWYNLQSNGKLKNQLDSSSIMLQEYLTYGKRLSQPENDSILNRFGNIKFDSITKFYSLPENLVLPFEHNQISFEFAAIETSRPFLIKYQYILEGYSKNWSPVTNRSNASFGNMTEGTYTFKLKAQGTNGMWTKPISYTFKVLPPWWRKWWAYVSYMIIFIVFIYQFLTWRTKSLQKEKELLEVNVSKRTSELKNSLENLKATQAQLVQSEKMASLGELTAGIAHEIQNPLNFVNNFSELSVDLAKELKEEVEKLEIAEKDKEYVNEIIGDLSQNQEKINHHGKRASSIVKGMLEHSRKSSGEKELSDINALCDEYLRLAYHGLRAKDKSFNATMETHFDPNLPKIKVIPQDIGRVILNLINNAFYAVSEKSKVESHKPGSGYEPTVSITTQLIANSQLTANGQLLIAIKDNGSGIPLHIKDKIFQPFFTTKPTGQGTGLGLSLAYDIVKAHGGELKVETKSGEGLTDGKAGSEFMIMLPLT
ncbi:MAG: hypothetical protein IPM42_20570 [Saprospiraceae bacterium]|nr:hypothetical protein [Saprospiraceae bacterium]